MYKTKKQFFKLLLTVLVFYLIYKKCNIKFDLKRIIDISFFGWFLYIFLNFFIIIIKTFKWHYLLKKVNFQCSFNLNLNAVLTGSFFGLFTPAGIGELLRNMHYKNKFKISFTVLLEKILDLLILLFIVLITVNYFYPSYFYIICFVVFTIFILCYAVFKFLKKIKLKNKFLPKTLNLKILNILLIIKEINKCHYFKYFFLSFGYVFLTILRTLIIFYFCFGILDFRIMLALPIVILISSLPITFGGLGIREGFSSYFFYNFFEIPYNVTFNVFIINYLLTFFVIILFNCIFLIKKIFIKNES